jgi:hypothetical protein
MSEAHTRMKQDGLSEWPGAGSPYTRSLHQGLPPSTPNTELAELKSAVRVHGYLAHKKPSQPLGLP